LQYSGPNHYATLGLDRGCTAEQIRDAYRLLAKQFHPDINPRFPDALSQTQALNLAYEILGDVERRRIYDRELASAEKTFRSRAVKTMRNLSQDMHLRIDEFLRGTTREVRVHDPGNPGGSEVYELIVPPETAVGTRFRLPRADGGFVIIRARALPGFQFKVRGSDLRCDLKISSKRAAQGGEEVLTGAMGTRLRIKIKAGVACGEVVRIADEGLPRPRGGRGDLLVRIVYRPEVRVSRPIRR
jgi:DnaJ-class molecular chaperone